MSRRSLEAETEGCFCDNDCNNKTHADVDMVHTDTSTDTVHMTHTHHFSGEGAKSAGEEFTIDDKWLDNLQRQRQHPERGPPSKRTRMACMQKQMAITKIEGVGLERASWPLGPTKLSRCISQSSGGCSSYMSTRVNFRDSEQTRPCRGRRVSVRVCDA